MKLKNIIITTFLSFLFLTSCSTIKTVILMKKGTVSQKEFKVEVPFEYRLGLIILKVSIEGEEYDFLLDTGAPNVISKELAKKLNVNIIASQKVGDSNNNDSDLGFAKLEKIKIGGLDFLNTGIAISDIKSSQEVNCLNIDGLIGSNLMRKAIWKFDFSNQIITITNTLDSLNISSNIETIPFFSEITGTPLCDIKINGQVEKNVVIDLGSNGDFTCSNNTLAKIKKNQKTFPKMISFGKGGSGLYGVGELDTTNFIVSSNISFGDVILNNQIVEFSTGSSTIGMNFFRNYDLILDWINKEALLIKKKEYDYTSYSGFGFTWIFEEGNLIIGSLKVGSNAQKKGLKLEDSIVSINGKNFSKTSSQEWCEIIKNQTLSNFEKIDITILRNGEKLNFQLQKELLLK